MSKQTGKLAPFSRQLTIRQRTEAEPTRPLQVPITVPVTNAKTNAVTLYTAPSAKFFHIERMGVCNVGSGNANIDVHLVPDGGSQDDTNVVYDGYALSSGASENLDAIEGALIEPGTAIVVFTDDGTNGANFWLWGVEIDGGNIAV